jgi:hypothetical protein
MKQKNSLLNRSKSPNSAMSDDEIYLAHGSPSHFEMDEAFCARMRAAITAGLESAPIGVVTKPGTKNPKYVPADRLALASSQASADL